MDRYQVRSALLKISIVALMASSWVFWSFIFATRPEESEADPLTSLVRLPASLPTQLPESLPGVFAPQVRVNEPIEMDTVKVACWDSSDEAEQDTSAHWIRLTGKTCRGVPAADSVTVSNLTNGYTATVFASPGVVGMTTDFIPLQAGRNEILVKYVAANGSPVERQFLFQRE